MATTATTTSPLADLCEPLFQHVCRLSRAARKSAGGIGGVFGGGEAEIRARTHELLNELQSRARAEDLSEQFEKVRLPLLFFCDYAIQHSDLPFAREWRAMAEVDEDPPHLGWYQEFFVMLDETLEERTDSANERLLIFYNCIGLGFKGYLEEDPKAVQDKMRELHVRIRKYVEADAGADICDQAYKYTDKRQLDLPAARTLTPIAVGLVGLLITLFALNFYLFHAAASDLKTASNKVVELNKSNLDSGK